MVYEEVIHIESKGGSTGGGGGGSGDVVGPSSSINNRVVFFDGTTGKLIKDSGLTLSGTNTGDQDLSPYFNKGLDDTDDIAVGATNKFVTATEKTKLGFISVTQAVDLDTIETNANNVPGIKSKTDFITVTQPVDLDQIETDIAALANGMVYKGNWDASVGTFPGAGSAKIGWFYTVSVGGTVGGQVFNIGDRLIATVNNASTTIFAANWSMLDATDAVTSVFGRVGNVVAQPGDYTKSDVGLGNVDNTSDLNKPISTATQTALNLKANDSNVVHKTGNEAIAGDKTFQDKIIQTVVTGEVPYEVNDGTNTYFQIRVTGENALVIGNEAGTGLGATEINNNIVGYQAGYGATGSSDTQMIGNQAGYGATNSTASNFIGPGAGASSTDTTLVTYIGTAAGNASSNSTYSTYIGNNAGLLASGTTDSIYVGRDTGRSATNTTSGIFIGKEAGRGATGSNYSTLIGHQAGKQFTGNNIGTNNIIIGTNVSLPNTTTNSLNIGGAIQATGLYSTTTGNPSTSPVAGSKVGIGTNTPSEKLHVIGNILSSGTITGSNLSGTNTGDQNAAGVSYNPGTNIDITATDVQGALDQTDNAIQSLYAGRQGTLLRQEDGTDLAPAGEAEVINFGSGLTATYSGSGTKTVTITSSGGGSSDFNALTNRPYNILASVNINAILSDSTYFLSGLQSYTNNPFGADDYAILSTADLGGGSYIQVAQSLTAPLTIYLRNYASGSWGAWVLQPYDSGTNIGVLDEAYNATTWNGNNHVPTKNAIRDKIESMGITKGIAEVDFGENGDIATVTVTNATITTTSYPVVTMYALTTTDHDPDDYMAEGLIPYVSSVNAGVGFNISVRAPNTTRGKYKVTYAF